MPKKSALSKDTFLHDVSNLSTALTFVTDELTTINHTDPTVNELIGGLSILTGRLHRAVKERIIKQTATTTWPGKKTRKK